MGAPLAGQNVTELLLFFGFVQRYRDLPADFNLTLFVDDTDNGHGLGTPVAAVAYATMAVAFVVVVLRLFVRKTRGLQRWGWDDWCIIPATAATIGYTAIQGIVTTGGCAGTHVYDVSISSLKYSYTYEYAGTMVYLLASQLIRTSILLFTSRLSPGRRMQHIVTLTQIIVFASFAGCVMTLTFSCTPVSAIYDLEVAIQPSTDCYAVWKPLLAWSVVHAVLDMWLVILPMSIVWRLNMPQSKRVGVLLVFSCGFMACAASIAKASTIRLSYNNFDACYKFTVTLIASQLELTFGLTVASLPALNHLILRFSPSSRKRSTSWGPSPGGVLSPSHGARPGHEWRRNAWETTRGLSRMEPVNDEPQSATYVLDDTSIGLAITSPDRDTQKHTLDGQRFSPLSFEPGVEDAYYRLAGGPSSSIASGPSRLRQDTMQRPTFDDIAMRLAREERDAAAVEEQRLARARVGVAADDEVTEDTTEDLDLPLSRPILSFADSEYSIELVLQKPP